MAVLKPNPLDRGQDVSQVLIACLLDALDPRREPGVGQVVLVLQMAALGDGLLPTVIGEGQQVGADFRSSLQIGKVNLAKNTLFETVGANLPSFCDVSLAEASSRDSGGRCDRPRPNKKPFQ